MPNGSMPTAHPSGSMPAAQVLNNVGGPSDSAQNDIHATSAQNSVPADNIKITSKDPQLAQRRAYQTKIRNHMAVNSKNTGCGPCKKDCKAQKTKPIRPDGFIFSINEPNFGPKKGITGITQHHLIYDRKADNVRAALWVSSNLGGGNLDLTLIVGPDRF